MQRTSVQVRPAIGILVEVSVSIGRESKMPFPDEVVREAWERAKGQCQCDKISHAKHYGEPCPNKLVWENRGSEDEGGWEAHHVSAMGGGDTLMNCEILCWTCFEASY